MKIVFLGPKPDREQFWKKLAQWKWLRERDPGLLCRHITVNVLLQDVLVQSQWYNSLLHQSLTAMCLGRECDPSRNQPVSIPWSVCLSTPCHLLSVIKCHLVSCSTPVYSLTSFCYAVRTAENRYPSSSWYHLRWCLSCSQKGENNIFSFWKGFSLSYFSLGYVSQRRILACPSLQPVFLCLDIDAGFYRACVLPVTKTTGPMWVPGL